MYLDLDHYRKVLKFVWAHRQWPGRRKALAKLLLWVPLRSAIHGFCMALDYIFFPALWRQEVKAPVFIVGHARSGTTLMHRLMAADSERFSYFLYWETFFPALTQRAVIRAIGWLDQRLLGGRLRRRLETWDEKTFGRWRHIHSQGLWIAEEDLFVLNAALLSQQWTLEFPAMHQADLFHIDQLTARRRRRWLKFYKACVRRQLVARGGERTHLSKNPAMSGWVSALLETFPDARIVVMVRDPVQCIPSALRMMESAWQARRWRPEDYADALEAMTAISFDSYRLPEQALAGRADVPHVFVDYRDLVGAPRDTVESVYQALDMPITESYRQFLAAQEAREKKHQSTFQYDLDDYAVSTARIETTLAEFYRRYDWPRPSAQGA